MKPTIFKPLLIALILLGISGCTKDPVEPEGYGVIVFSNPGEDMFNVALEIPRETSVRLVLVGENGEGEQLVFQRFFSNAVLTFEFGDRPDGLYILEYTFEDLVGREKIIKDTEE